MYTETCGIRLPARSQANRSITKGSKGHCTAFAVLGKDNGRRFQAESHLELQNLLVVNALPDLAELKEQVLFEWYEKSDLRRHYFDLIAVLNCGHRIAFTVKPERRLNSGKFLAEMRGITSNALGADFCDEVRLVTDRDIDPIHENNARVLAALTDVDPTADRIASEIAGQIVGAVSLRDFALATGLQARGYRASLRLIRDQVLSLTSHENITPQTFVRRMETVQ